MFYKVASGLCLYFIVSSLWGIAERKALPQSAAGSAPGGSGPDTKRPPPDGGGNGGNVKPGGGNRDVNNAASYGHVLRWARPGSAWPEIHSPHALRPA